MLGEKLFARYEILSELGRGGMGVVYRARDPLLNREVAVKVIAPSMLTPESETRFQTEAQLVAQMDHPSVVSIYDFGRHEGSLFFVMPIVVGNSLRDLQRRNELTLAMAVDIGAQIAEALDYSHARGVVHRDIKPENIMVSVDSGGSVRVRVMDFGLARSTGVSNLTLTRTGMVMGTMWYISPEQVSGKAVDGRSDIYSLGSVLYECVTGEVPFSGEMQSLFYRIVHELPQSPRSRGCKLDEEFDQIILACLAKDPAQRPQKAGDVARALRRYRAVMRDGSQALSTLATAAVMVPRPAMSPFVGREQEVRELQERFNAALRGECQFVVISGEPGVGKTRLVDELGNLAMARQVRVLHGRFVEQHGAFPYHGFCEAIQEFYRQKELGSSSSAPTDISDLAADLIALFPMLSEIPSIRDAAGTSSSMAVASESRSSENRNQVFELLARTLTRLAAGKPLVLIFEDLHSAEVSIEALQYIVRRLGPTPTMIVGTFRSTEVDRRHPVTQMLDSFHGDRRFLSRSLGPLSSPDHLLFLSTLTAGNGISPVLSRRLYEATEGNPFFTKELVRSLLDSGSISQDETGTWSLSGGADISSAVLPATIQQAVETRVGRLPDALRGILSIASVMGKAFEFEDLEALVDDVDDVDDAVDRLIQEGLLEEDRQSRGDKLAFASAVVREVLYAGLARRKRRQLHRKYAERLEKRNTGRLERVYPQLLYHYYEADDPERTVEYGLLYARKSVESFSPEEVIRAARTALEFLDEDYDGDPSTEGDARMLLAAGHRMAGDMSAALKETIAAVRIFEREGKPAQTVKALLAAAKAAWQVRQIEETRRWVERGIEAARTHGQTVSLEQFLSLAATLANLRGEYETAAGYLRESERLAEGSRKIQVQDEIPRGGRLTVGLANPVAAQSPVRMHLSEEFEVLSIVFDTLLQTDEEGNLHSDICTGWEMHDEGRTFRFILRRDVRFQDGHPLASHDIKESFENAIRGAAELPPGFSAIRGARDFAGGTAQALDAVSLLSDTEFEVRLEEPLPIYPALLTDRRTAIMRSPSGPGALPVGTGPFRLGLLEREKVVVHRHDDYWKGTPARLDTIEFRAGMSAASLAAAFRAGELDVVRDLNPSDLEDILRDPRFHDCLIESPQRFTYFILFNTRSGPVAKSAVLRRVLSGSLRVRDLVWQSLGRFAEPATCLVPPGILGHDAGRRTQTPLPADEARDLLRAAGFDGKIRLKAAVHPLFQDRYASLLQALFSAWAELGVEVSVETSGTDSYLSSWQNNEGLDLILTRYKPDVDDPDSCTHALFHSGTGLMRAYFNSGETDHLLESARRENSPAVRQTLYRKFENSLLEGSILAPLFHDVGYRLFNSSVRGIRLRSIHPCVNYSEMGKAGQVRVSGPLQRQGGGVIRVPFTRRVRILDPMPSALVEETEVQSPIFETLMRDVGLGRIEPWLASDLRVENAGKRYRFKLRADVNFHDGRRLSARDVRFSLERLLHQKESEARWFYAPIRGAKEVLERGGGDLRGFQIHSATEFSIELEQPLAFFPVLLAGINLSIVPEGTLHIGNSIADGAIGTGPFRVARFEPGVELELERNPYYWKKGTPKCERLLFRFGLPASEILSEFKAGKLSLASDLFPSEVEALRRDPRFAVGYQESPRLSVYVIGFNIHRGPLRDRAVRKRVLQCVDMNRIVRQTLGSLAIPAHGIIPPGLLGHDALPNLAENVPSRKPARESGGQEIELTAAVHPIFKAEYSAFFDEFTRSCQAAGVRINVKSETIPEYMDARVSGATDMLIGRWIADYPDADTFAYMLHSPDGNIGRLCGTPETDRMIAQGRAETDPQARHAIYRQFEELLEREALVMPLFHEQVYRFSRPEVDGLSVSYWQPTVAYEKLSILGASARSAL
jgi:ABC-type transport system substrate-binding protein